MSFLSPYNKTNKSVSKLLNSKNNDAILEQIVSLQNKISIVGDLKVTAVMPLDSDSVGSAFSIAFAEAFSSKKLSTLIIDSNMYRPTLFEVTGNDKKIDLNEQVYIKKFSEYITLASFGEQKYPSDIYKNGSIKALIEKNQNIDRFVVIVPSIVNSKEITLLSDIVGSVVILANKNVTKKAHIFNATRLCKQNNIKVSNVVIIK